MNGYPNAPYAIKDELGASGRLAVFAYDMTGESHDITKVRGVPIEVSSFTVTDPFGPSDAQLKLNSVTLLDGFASHDLPWYYPGANIDICWVSNGSVLKVLWEGYMISFNTSTSSGSTDTAVIAECIGAMRQLDDFVSKQTFPSRPVPYEYAIRDAIPSYTKLKPLKTIFPDDWDIVYEKDPKAVDYMVPQYVKDGQPWTGLVTRTTGDFSPVLTSYIQGLLQSMYTKTGQWTLMLDTGRHPVLKHRTNLTTPASDTIMIDVVSPGVSLSNVIRDYKMKIDSVYGSGSSITGESYSNMTVMGKRTVYKPFATTRESYPASSTNDWFDPMRIRREVSLSFQKGLTAKEAMKVSENHLRKYSDPGFTGTMTIASDLRDFSGNLVKRWQITAGNTFHIDTLFGEPGGVTVHATAVTHNPSAGTVDVTFDSKFRDALTVDEVMMRGRDALTPNKLMSVNSYLPPVPDMLVPWQDGKSGFIPDGSQQITKFDGKFDDVEFPWTEWTKRRPPKDPSWENCYIRIPAPNVLNDANKLWSQKANSGSVNAYPIFIGQAATIRLIQVAAYDRNGEVMKVPFHVSLYYYSTVKISDMPLMSAEAVRAYNLKKGTLYKDDGQHHPFFPNAWNEYNEDGTKSNEELRFKPQNVGWIAGWGSSYAAAGYMPGSPINGDAPTGLLSDESQFQLTVAENNSSWEWFNSDDKSRDLNMSKSYIYAMIFCEDHTEDVYFLGRMYNKPPDMITG